MQWVKCLTPTIFILFLMSHATNAETSKTIEGIWKSTDELSKIEIRKCGNHYCNKIVWLKKPRKDVKNENENLRDRSLVGAQISNNLQSVGKNLWQGSVYSPKKGKVYSGFASVSGDNLIMKGCLTKAGILCQKAHFKRDNETTLSAAN